MPNKTPSNSIRIFPSSNRSSNSGHYTDNFVTEYNLSSIVNKLLLQGYNKNGAPTSVVYNGVSVPINGFIISDNPTATTIDFNINGYFINVSRSDILNAIGSEKITPSETLYQDFIWFEEINNRVYALAKFTNTNGEEEGLKHLDGTDSNTSTTIDKTVTATDDVVALPLYETNSCTAFVPTSKLRLTNFAIDDGEL